MLLLCVCVCAGQVTTLAGDLYPGSADGVGSSASFLGPSGLAVDPASGLLYVTDTFNCEIRSINAATGLSIIRSLRLSH